MKRTYKALICTILTLLVTIASASASAISFQVIQHDTSIDKVRDASREIEGAVMEYFFDQGYIVTNSPTIICSTKDDEAAAYQKSMDEALDGNCDVFISVFVDYDIADSSAPDLLLLSNIKQITWISYDVRTGKKQKSGGKLTGKVDPKDNTDVGIENFTREVAAQINSTLNR